jgi:hypothetical protein
MPTLSEDIKAVTSAISLSVESAFETGCLIAQACDRHKNFIDQVRMHMKGAISIAYLRRLEKVGRLQLHPSFVVGCCSAISFIERLSYKDQEVLATKGIKFPVGENDHIIKFAPDLSYQDAKAALHGGIIAQFEVIRSRVGEMAKNQQERYKTFIEGQEESSRERQGKARKVEKLGITCKGNTITINAKPGTKIKADDLAAFVWEHNLF